MNATDDKTLSREARIGLFVFLLAERMRHYKDIAMINEMLEQLQKELNIRPYEYYRYEEEARKYIEF